MAASFSPMLFLAAFSYMEGLRGVLNALVLSVPLVGMG